MRSKGQTFTKSVGKPVLPAFLSVVFDPTRADFKGIALNGTYAYDDEGVKARRIVAVENGILKTFLMSRSPIDGFPNSNGHGRRSPGQRNRFAAVEPDRRIVEQGQRRRTAQNADRGSEEAGQTLRPVFRSGDRRLHHHGQPRIAGLHGDSAGGLSRLPDGRPDELIRGADIVGTPLASFEKIMATSDKMEVFNGICGAESGSVPVSAVAPALLVSQIEIQRKERSQDRPPILARPSGEAAAMRASTMITRSLAALCSAGRFRYAAAASKIR